MSMNGSFWSTDIYLTSPESTFCPLFVVFHKKLVTLKKIFYLENKANFEHFADTTSRKPKVIKELFSWSTRQNPLFQSYKCFSPIGLFSERRKYNIFQNVEQWRIKISPEQFQSRNIKWCSISDTQIFASILHWGGK
jgi:hypothetical protein